MNSIPDPLAPWRPDVPLTDDELQCIASVKQQLPGELDGMEMEARRDGIYLRVSERSLFKRLWGRLLSSRASLLASRWTKVGDMAIDTGQMSFCVIAYSLSLRLRLINSPSEDTTVAESAQDLAWGMIRNGRHIEAARLLQWVIQVRQRVLGSDAPLTLGAINDLASARRDVGDLSGAKELQETALAGCRRVLGPEHPHTLTVADNLAMTMLALGDLVSARKLGEQVLTIQERLLGFEDPSTLNTAGNLAMIIKAQGGFADARKLEERVLAVLQTELGPENPTTLTAAGNLAVTMHEQGDLVGARELAECVFATSKRSLGPDHHYTLMAANNLAQTMLELDDLPRARALHQYGFSARERLLGRDHPFTLVAANNLAMAMADQGDLAGARTLHEYNLAVSERVLGYNHLDTLTEANNLASVMQDQGDLVGARKLQEHVFSTRKVVLGSEHPLTLRAAGNLATTISSQGDLASARKMEEYIFTVSDRLLGSEHPSTIIAAGNLTHTLLAMGCLTEAREMLFLTLRRVAKTRDVGDVVFSSATGALLYLEQVLDRWARNEDFVLLFDLLAEVSRNLQSLLELRQVKGSGSLIPLFFSGFHCLWLKLCLHSSPERCPEAIAPLHGIEAWSAALGELLAAQATATLNAPQRALLAARAALNDIRARIAHLDARILQVLSDDSSGGDVQAQETWRARLRVQLLAERDTEAATERASLAEYKRAREALAAADPTFAGALRPAPQRATDYAAHLRPDEALLILFLIGEHGAFVIRADGRHGELALPDLNRFATLVRESEELWRGGHRGGLRDWLDANEFSTARLIEFDEPGPAEALAGTGDAAPPKPPPALADLKQAASAGFWTPLREVFGEVRRWHIVTGPGQHTLPLELGRTEVAARYYCGLPAYWRLRDQPLPLPAPGSGMDIAVDVAWGTRSPIPFVECEADLIRHIVTGRNTATRRRDGAALLDDRPLAARVHVACHGQAVGAVGRAHGVLVLDAASGVVLEPARAAHLPGPMAELFASSCLGGVVGQTEGGDAQGMVPPLQLRGLPAIIACLAPVPDFYMPILAALYWHARVAGVLPHEALEQAKSQLRSGNWPPELLTPVRAAFTVRMTDVLERAAAREPVESSVMAAARSVAGWCLPEEVRKRHFWKPSRELSREDLRGFVQEWCASADRRAALVTEVADRLIAGRHDLPAASYAAIEHLCAYTVCFGDVAHAGEVP